MKYVLLLLLTAILNVFVYAQETLIAFQYTKTSKLGYMTIDEEVIIEPQFRAAQEFYKGGIAFAMDAGSKSSNDTGPGNYQFWLAIDRKGNRIDSLSGLRPMSELKEYSNRFGTINGVAFLYNGKRFFGMTEEGKLLFEEGFDNLYPFREGYSYAYRGDQWYILNDKGESFPIKDNRFKPKAVCEGLIRVLELDAGSSNVGFIDLEGNVVIEPIFQNTGNFSGCGLTWARSPMSRDYVGIINKAGEWVFEPQFIYAYEFDCEAGATTVELPHDQYSIKERYKIIKKNGETVTMPDSLHKYYRFHNGLAMFRIDDKNGKLGYMNSDGIPVIAAKYDVAHDFEDGVARVEIKNRHGLINKQGEEVVPVENNEIYGQADGCIMIERKRRIGFYNYKDNILIEPKFIQAKPFKNGYASVMDPETKLWGLIDNKGNWKIEPKYGELMYVTKFE